MSDQTPVKLADLEEALLFVDAGGGYDTAAWVCRETGAALLHSEDAGEWEPVLPADIDDAARHAAAPGKHDLGLGKLLALEFAPHAATGLLRADLRHLLAPRRLRPLQGSAGPPRQPRRLARLGGGTDPTGAAHVVRGQRHHVGRLTDFANFPSILLQRYVLRPTAVTLRSNQIRLPLRGTLRVGIGRGITNPVDLPIIAECTGVKAVFQRDGARLQVTA